MSSLKVGLYFYAETMFTLQKKARVATAGVTVLFFLTLSRLNARISAEGEVRLPIYGKIALANALALPSVARRVDEKATSAHAAMLQNLVSAVDELLRYGIPAMAKRKRSSFSRALRGATEVICRIERSKGLGLGPSALLFYSQFSAFLSAIDDAVRTCSTSSFKRLVSLFRSALTGKSFRNIARESVGGADISDKWIEIYGNFRRLRSLSKLFLGRMAVAVALAEFPPLIASIKSVLARDNLYEFDHDMSSLLGRMVAVTSFMDAILSRRVLIPELSHEDVVAASAFVRAAEKDIQKIGGAVQFASGTYGPVRQEKFEKICRALDRLQLNVEMLEDDFEIQLEEYQDVP